MKGLTDPDIRQIYEIIEKADISVEAKEFAKKEVKMFAISFSAKDLLGMFAHDIKMGMQAIHIQFLQKQMSRTEFFDLVEFLYLADNDIFSNDIICFFYDCNFNAEKQTLFRHLRQYCKEDEYELLMGHSIIDTTKSPLYQLIRRVCKKHSITLSIDTGAHAYYLDQTQFTEHNKLAMFKRKPRPMERRRFMLALLE